MEGVDMFVFFLILEEMLVTIEYDVGYVFVIYDFYYVEISSFHDHFLERFFFYHKCWILIKLFMHLTEMIILYLFLHSLNMLFNLNIEKFFYPQDKSYLIMVSNPFYILLNLTC